MPPNPQRRVHALLGVCGLSKTCRRRTKTQPFTDLILHAPQFFTSLTLANEIKMELEERQSRELAEAHAKN
jgi:hypothetical protein